jgi:hypothetical protein
MVQQKKQSEAKIALKGNSMLYVCALTSIFEAMLENGGEIRLSTFYARYGDYRGKHRNFDNFFFLPSYFHAFGSEVLILLFSHFHRFFHSS